MFLLQVIEEIEEIMQDSAGVEADHPPGSGLSAGSAEVRRDTSSPSFEKSEWVPVGFPPFNKVLNILT